MQPPICRARQEHGSAAVAARTSRAFLVCQGSALQVQVIERVPEPGELQVLIQVENEVAQNIHRLLGSLRPSRKHPLQSGECKSVSVRQADGFMMESRKTLVGALFAVGFNPAIGQLFGNPANVRLSNYVSQQVQFLEQLPALHVVRGVEPVGVYEEMTARHNASKEG